MRAIISRSRSSYEEMYHGVTVSLSVVECVPSSQGLIVPFLFVIVIGTAIRLTRLATLFVAFFPQFSGALAKIRPGMATRAVVEGWFCGLIFGDFFLLCQTILFHRMAFLLVYAIIVPAGTRVLPVR